MVKFSVRSRGKLSKYAGKSVAATSTVRVGTLVASTVCCADSAALLD